MGEGKWGILKLLPEYILFCDTECFEFFSGTLHHSWWSTEVVLLVFSYIFRSYPVSDVSGRVFGIEYLVFRRKIRDTREILYIFKVFKTFPKFEYFLFIKAILECTYSEYECDFPSFLISQRVSECLAIYRRKSCTSSDKTLVFIIVLEDKVSKWEHTRKYCPNLCVTYYRTPTTVRNPLDDECKCFSLKTCNRIRTIQSWCKLEHDVLPMFWILIEHTRTWVDELIDIVCEHFFLYEGELGSEHCMV